MIESGFTSAPVIESFIWREFREVVKELRERILASAEKVAKVLSDLLGIRLRSAGRPGGGLAVLRFRECLKFGDRRREILVHYGKRRYRQKL